MHEMRVLVGGILLSEMRKSLAGAIDMIASVAASSTAFRDV